MFWKAIAGLEWLNDWIGKILYPLMLGICIVVFIEVALRYLFSRPTLWSFETTQFMFMVCTFFAGGHLYLRNEHINVDIFYGRLSARGKFILDLLTFPFFALFIGAMAYFGYQFAYDSLMKLEHTGSAWDPPIYPIKFCVPVAATLLFLQGIANLAKSFRHLWQDCKQEKGAEASSVP